MVTTYKILLKIFQQHIVLMTWYLILKVDFILQIFRGYSTNPLGGVYYVSPDFRTVTPIIQNISVANGIALSTDEKVLWVTETTANRLHRIALEDDGVTIQPFGATIPYYFTGHEGPDSCCIDSDDNLYVAMYGQGRVLVFNKRGYPIGQILIPGRDEGHMLRSTHPQFIPGTNQLIICSNDIEWAEDLCFIQLMALQKVIKVFSFDKTYLNERRLKFRVNS